MSLNQFRKSVRARISHDNYDLFEVTSSKHISIVIEELFYSAKEDICIYCEEFNEDIEKLCIYTSNKIVPIKVIINKISTKPYFILIDGKRYLLKDNINKNILCCTRVSDKNKTDETANAMKKYFNDIWSSKID